MTSQPGPGKMLAMVYHKYGSPDVLKLETRDRPKRGPGEVLVQITATSVNPVDVKVRSGKFVPPFSSLVFLPKIPGGDLAGIVEEADTKFSKFQYGDRVFGLADTVAPFKTSGTVAQFISVREDWLTEIPGDVPDDVAGATPLVALTAYQALEPANLQVEQRVLIHGGSGGVGHVAIQLAKLKGCYVVTTCSPKHSDFCKKLGADEVVDYHTERFDQKYAKDPFDAIVDTIGSSYWFRSQKVLKRGGYYAHLLTGAWIKGLPVLLNFQLECMAAGIGKAKAWLTGSSYKYVFVQPSGSQMRAIAKLMDEEKLKIHIHKKFKFEDASEAHRALEQGHVAGKISITVPTPEQIG